MTKLNKEIEQATEQDKKDVPVDLEVLTEVVESELDNIAGGGFDQYSAAHGANIAMK